MDFYQNQKLPQISKMLKPKCVSGHSEHLLFLFISTRFVATKSYSGHFLNNIHFYEFFVKTFASAQAKLGIKLQNYTQRDIMMIIILVFLLILANRDAVFTSQHILYKLQDSELNAILEAHDPDHPNDTAKVQFSLETVMDGVTVSSSGTLNGQSTANINTTINIQLADGCGSTNTLQIVLEVVECPCHNSGTCIPKNGSQPGSGQFQCQCVEGTMGQLCETDTIDSCTPNHVGTGSVEINRHATLVIVVTVRKL